MNVKKLLRSSRFWLAAFALLILVSSLMVLFFARSAGGTVAVITQDGADGEEEAYQHISNFRRGAVCGYKYFSPAKAAALSVTVRGSGRGCMIASDGLNELARITLLPSPGWQTFTAPFACPGEKFALYLTFEGDGAIDILAFELS